MKVVIQRVTEAFVTVKNTTVGKINKGIVVFLGIKKTDTVQDIEYLIDKILYVRIFENEKGLFDKSISEISGDILIVSQFTLYGDCSKGRRPSFSEAMSPSQAKVLYDVFIQRINEKYSEMKIKGSIATGIFGAMMKVSLINDGPVTLIINSKNK